MRGHVYMRGGAECYVMRYLVAMISTLRSPLRVTLFSLTLIGLLSYNNLQGSNARRQPACLRCYGTETPVNLRGRIIGFRVRLLD